jgi:radical SAM protein with 4Fe4S-binding SPASM domain
MENQTSPLAAQFELTQRCNLKCQHCYLTGAALKKEMGFNKVCRAIDKLSQEGCFWLCFTGGEPLLREDFCDIYTYAYKKGFLITVFTNATLVNKKIANLFFRLSPFCVETTFNAATKNTFDNITGVKGSFLQALSGIKLMHDLNIPLKLKCQAMTLNYKELSLMRKLYRKFGSKFYCSTLIDPSINGSLAPCKLRLDERRLKSIFSSRNNPADIDRAQDCKDKKLYSCGMGRWNIYIDPSARFSFCNLLRKPGFDLFKSSLENSFRVVSDVQSAYEAKLNKKCLACNFKQSCRNCPARAWLELKDKSGIVDYFCRLAKLGKSDN